jgi:hypothetical protein
MLAEKASNLAHRYEVPRSTQIKNLDTATQQIDLKNAVSLFFHPFSIPLVHLLSFLMIPFIISFGDHHT